MATCIQLLAAQHTSDHQLARDDRLTRPLSITHTFMTTCRLSADSTTKGTCAKLLASTERSRIPKKQRKATPKSYNRHAVFVRGTCAGKVFGIGEEPANRLLLTSKPEIGKIERQKPKMAGPINSIPPRRAPRDPKNQTAGAPKSHNQHALSGRGVPLRQKLLESEETLRIDRHRPPQRPVAETHNQ